jgi:hypothetical protein
MARKNTQEDDSEDEFEDEDSDGYVERDPPDVGDTVRGSVLVCRGDDQPDEFTGELEVIVQRYRFLESLAGQYKLGTKVGKIDFDQGLSEFLSAGGVDFDANHWEGACISGIYMMGWVPEEKESAVELELEQMLDACAAEVRKAVLKGLRDDIELQMKGLDLDALLELQQNRSFDLKREVDKLRKELERAQSKQLDDYIKIEDTKSKLKAAKEEREELKQKLKIAKEELKVAKEELKSAKRAT